MGRGAGSREQGAKGRGQMVRVKKQGAKRARSRGEGKRIVESYFTEADYLNIYS